MRMPRNLAGALLLAVTLPSAAMAQRTPGEAPPRGRQQMEQRLQQGVWRIAKQRIQLSDEQMTKLEGTAGRFDVRRRALIADERAQRQTLRQELMSGDRANQDRVAAALDRLQALQRQRVDLMAEEQRELATFMTPVQRAKFAALQEQLRRRVANVRARRGATPAP
jgi:Spy/CpxP family protein refolding chaperone